MSANLYDLLNNGGRDARDAVNMLKQFCNYRPQVTPLVEIKQDFLG